MRALGSFWMRWGYYCSSSHPEGIQRFRCRLCRVTFSRTVFLLEYRAMKRFLNYAIFQKITTGHSACEIARQLHCSEHLVRERLRKLARHAFLRHTELIEGFQIREDVVFDGLENFAGSQYDPNHIQHAVLRDSLFILNFNFAPLNRKGKMTEEQKVKNEEIQKTQGKYPKKAIRWASKELFEWLLERKSPEMENLTLVSDEHFQYRRAIEWDLSGAPIRHIRISSRKTRNYQNLLFSVNHADLLTRQQLAAFQRETISFCKTHQAMIERYMLFMVKKNYMRTQFVKKLKRRPRAHLHTPAMEAGVSTHRFSFREFFGKTLSDQHVTLSREWKCFYDGVPTYKREPMKVAA